MSKAEDFAQELELAERTALIEKKRLQKPQMTFSHCVDCGDEIPQERQAIGGVCRCVDCQNYFENKQKRGL